MSVLEKATLILDVVAESPEDATLTSIAQRLGQPRSSTHRLLSELVQLGLLFRVGIRELRSRAAPCALGRGGRTASTTSSASRSRRWCGCATRSARASTSTCGSAIGVSASRPIDGNFELRHFTEVGKPLPLSVGASGKLLLAFADPATQAVELRRVAKEPLTPRAPTHEALAAQLDEIRESDWSISFGEREEGLAAAAVPIRDRVPATVAGGAHRLGADGPSDGRAARERMRRASAGRGPRTTISRASAGR